MTRTDARVFVFFYLAYSFRSVYFYVHTCDYLKQLKDACLNTNCLDELIGWFELRMARHLVVVSGSFEEREGKLSWFAIVC